MTAEHEQAIAEVRSQRDRLAEQSARNEAQGQQLVSLRVNACARVRVCACARVHDHECVYMFTCTASASLESHFCVPALTYSLPLSLSPSLSPSLNLTMCVAGAGAAAATW